jgi:hypothetical protein
MAGRARRGRDEEGRGEDNAGAWAAAAVVLALGGLGFGVAAQLRVGDLEQRVLALERTAERRADGTQQVAAPSTTATADAPDPGDAGEVPADHDAAEAAVRSAFVVLYDGARPIDDRLAAVDDPRGVEEALREASGGDLALQLANTKATVSDVDFTSSTTASVQFSVLVNGEQLVEDATGAARLVDGAWKVTRATVCANLEDAGSPCPP